MSLRRSLPVAPTTVSDNLLPSGVSGIMGLSFQTISALQATPSWQAPYNANMLTQPLFGFCLPRWITSSTVIAEAPGGSSTLGGTNTSLYTGDIEYINMHITVEGQSLQIPSSEGIAAIGTGTTIIGGPSFIVSEIWSAVPGAEALSGRYAGTYAFRTRLRLPIVFGSLTHSPHRMDYGCDCLDLVR
ncbi:aspartic peptidase domain-containing protein [Pisolithus marmoratus]|nr:aspartic peptidase domain-containing protein [Pisolithus marmoratus]